MKMKNFIRAGAFSSLTGILIPAAISLLATSQFSSAQEACLNDVAGLKNAVCTANDVRISRINVTDGPTECAEGEQVTISTLEAELLGGSKERYDIGIYLATDGGDAKVSLAGDDEGCLRDILTPQGEGEDEFDDLEGGGDFCGDIRQGILETKKLDQVTLTCQDTDDDGFLDVGTCLSWDNNKKDMCLAEEDAFPGTPSKCRCEPVQVGDITVNPAGIIIVEKVVVDSDGNPVDDDTVFKFSGDAVGEIKGGQTISVGGLEAGTYTSTEQVLEVRFKLLSIECDNVDSYGVVESATATFVLDADETVTCTFKNAILY